MKHENKRLMNINEMMEYMGLGRVGAMKWGKENDCIIRVGRRVFYDKSKIDKILDSVGSHK